MGIRCSWLIRDHHCNLAGHKLSRPPNQIAGVQCPVLRGPRYFNLKSAATLSGYQLLLARVDGAFGVNMIGTFFWLPLAGVARPWMGALCLTEISSHFLLIKAYDVPIALPVHLFAYFQLVFASAFEMWALGNIIDALFYWLTNHCDC